MTDPLEFLATEPAGLDGGADSQRERRELLIARRLGLCLGVFADETDGIVERKPTAPLPGAGPAILGLIQVRGRMSTLIDPLRLLPANGSMVATWPQFIVLLSGEDQIALAVDRVSSITEVFLDEIEHNGDGESLVYGTWRGAAETISILNLARLFDCAYALTD